MLNFKTNNITCRQRQLPRPAIRYVWLRKVEQGFGKRGGDEFKTGQYINFLQHINEAKEEEKKGNETSSLPRGRDLP